MAGLTTSSCFCGESKLSFSLDSEQIVAKFLCHCASDRHITGSTFASNLILRDTTLSHDPTSPALRQYLKTSGVDSGHEMTSFFCPTCGTTMYRVSSGFPGTVVIKIGTIDDVDVVERLRPEVEQFTGLRVGWVRGVEGVRQEEGNYFC